MYLRRMLTATCAIFAAACASSPDTDLIDVTVDGGAALDTTGYRLYRWRESANTYARAFDADGERADAMQESLRAAVNRALAERGYRQAFDEPPDFLVSYNVAVFEAMKPGVSDELKHRAREEAIRETAEMPIRDVDIDVQTETTRRATLVLRFEDADDTDRTWTGTASGPAGLFAAGRRGMDDAVHRIVDRFGR